MSFETRYTCWFVVGTFALNEAITARSQWGVLVVMGIWISLAVLVLPR
jgi:hypothetical protein